MNFTGILRDGEGERAVSATLGGGVLRGTVDGRAFADAAVERRGDGLLLVRGRAPSRAVVARDGNRVLVHLDGRVHEFELMDGTKRRRDRGGKRLHAGDEPWIGSPMTGTVASVAAAPGDRVAKGGTLVVVEAMKMQFVVRAPRDVVVKAVPAAAGRPVEIGQVLVEFEEAAP
ncbi:MAG: hypothetical protein L6R43_08320 [Planctomycetes bacterium]|nr:hypothetical protein [Planctomycetota bacterium]